MYDIAIKNGKIITGTGNPWFYGDVAIVGEKIVRIGALPRAEALTVVDAKGCFVAPGFIDGHSHSDLMIFRDPTADSKVMQGVTTENLGLDGLSMAPIREEDITAWRTQLAGLAGNPNIDWTWRSFGDYFDAIDALPPSDNITAYVGLGTIRLHVMGMTDRPATADEIDGMKRLAAQAMEAGARGISAGLIYPPSQYQTVAEVVEIAKIVREYDGIYDVHLRSEGPREAEAIEEVIEIGRKSDIPVLITHFKVAGKKNWGRAETMLGMIDKARTEGVDVTIAQYPYTAGSTMLLSVVPPWYFTKGPDGLIRALTEERDRVKRDICERSDWENIPMANGWENVIVSSVESDANKACVGKSITEIASLKGSDAPEDAALDLLVEEQLAVGMIVFMMDESDVMRIMKHPTVSYITDGLLGGTPHPRLYGTYPRIFGKYVRDLNIVPVEDAVRKMTSLPAEKLRLKTKGTIAEGFDADITVFNPATISDHATYENPRQYSSGIEWVLVNGKVVVEKGRHTGARPGRTIRTR